MTENTEDADDGSVQEIAVNDRNPILATHRSITSAPEDRSQGPTSSNLETQEHDADRIVSDVEGVSLGGPEIGEPHGVGANPRSQAAADAPTLITVSLDRIKPHPMNDALFGATSPTEIQLLADSIGEVGLLERISVTPDLKEAGYYYYESGRKRGQALRSLGRKEVTVEVTDVKDEDERLLRLLEFNRKHILTVEQQIQIGEVYLGLESKQAKARQVAGGKLKTGAKVVETFTQALAHEGECSQKSKAEAAGKARDLAAAKVGLSGVGLERGIKVREAAAKAEKEGQREVAAELKQLLNDRGINPAFMRAKAYRLIQASKPKGKKVTAGGIMQNGEDPQKTAPQSAGRQSQPEENVVEVPPMSASGGAGQTAPGLEKVSDNQNGILGTRDHLAFVEELEGETAFERVIFHSQKLLDEFGYIEIDELTFDQKSNLRRALADVVECYRDCKEDLQ